MNILFTSVGRRVELIQTFRDAAQKTGTQLTIMGTDISFSAPAMYFCDRTFLVPKISDPTYISTLLTLCETYNVSCVIPTIDTDLCQLAETKDKFALIGTIVLVWDIEKVLLCRDKRLTATYFRNLGLKSPLPVDNISEYHSGYPAFIKPLNGSSSINAYKADNYNELELLIEMVPDYIIQPFISGREYTIDIFCDFNGNPIYITPRERLAVRSGEVLKTKICQDDVMIAEMKQLVDDFKPCGQITVQLIHDDASNQNYYIEINPRFGGGAPLSMKAGANSAVALIQLMQGKKVEYVEYAANDGAIYSRFDQSICIDKGISK